jgi:hypothetical protein
VELSEADAAELEVAEGNLLQATFPQRPSARHGPYQRHPAGVFAPFPYGSWDQLEGDDPGRVAPAVNQLAITESGPVSKRPPYRQA